MERLLADAHALTRDWWDPSQRLLTHPGGRLDDEVVPGGTHGLLPPTVWWAYGLLRRGAPGDRELAETAVRGVLDRQFDAPGAPWHATWPATTAATDPTPGAVPFQDYDPNWRVFVGAGLALVLRDHDLPAALEADVRQAVERAVAADADRTVDATWTNVAVLRAWLELEVGRWRGDEQLLDVGAARARAVAADAGVRGHVAEHASPTYTGITLLGLSLWAERPPVEDLAPLGRALRDEVLHDLLAIWHPGLRTLVPPFTRAYGMDLRTHVGATGLWLAWLVDGLDPLPPLHEPPLHHAQDLPLVFLVDALAGASQDVRALAPLVRAQPARQGEWFDRVGERVWTGWTGGDLAVGAEWSPVDWGGWWQMVTAAAIWRTPSGDNAWLRLQQRHGAVEARVEHDAGVVRLSHGVTVAPLELWLGGDGEAEVTPSTLALGGRTWRIEGVDEVRRVPCDAPGVELAWELVTDADGIALLTED